MKKRNCRKSPQEKEIHILAVKVRKMTDQQLADFLQEIQADAWQEGAAHGAGTERLLSDLEAGKCPGIGPMTARKIRRFVEERHEE